MQIRFVADDLVETEKLCSLFAAHQVASFRDNRGVDHDLKVAWSGPHSRPGFFDNLVEWIGELDFAAISVSVATGVLSNYLWSMIQRGRGNEPLRGSSRAVNPERVSPPFEGLSGVKFVLRNQGKQLELDPLTADYGTVEILVCSFFDDKNAGQI
jgi:hypothetical protein